MSKTWIYSHYQLNYETYSTKLCVNKNKPKLACHGKCQMKREMDQQDSKENSSLPKEPLSEFYFNNSNTICFPFEFPPQTKFSSISAPLLKGQLFSVFQPPERINFI
jgi:hypothetical protein